MGAFKIWSNGHDYAVDGKTDTGLIKSAENFATKRNEFAVHRYETAENRDMLLKAFLNNQQNC
uniref:Uncharacterized protein n=1 Tax=uncultured Alphaproteobacteria bacterium TaxID=91750 RepID=A0A6G8F2A3_9PROT|nr:hypothetical protein PlAlph_1000 [uncultured Alphaproteobacteria bacterium]